MVYYVNDGVNKDWTIVVHTKPREFYDIGEGLNNVCEVVMKAWPHKFPWELPEEALQEAWTRGETFSLSSISLFSISLLWFPSIDLVHLSLVDLLTFD